MIENDIRFLQDIGTTMVTGVKQGIRPRMLAFFKKMARQIGDGIATLEEVRPVLEFIARSYSPGWLLLADLEYEVAGEAGIESSADYVRRFLEERPPANEAEPAWQQLISIYRMTNNVVGGCSAFLRVAEITDPPLDQISRMAQWLNSERDVIDEMDVGERGALFKPLARLMEGYLQVASATELSRLAWLHLHAGDDRRALEVAELGLRHEPGNPHCQNLVDRLRNYR